MNSQEALNAVDLALLRAQQAIDKAQRAVDELNASVANNPAQMEFETRIHLQARRIATQCQCAGCQAQRLKTLEEGS